MSKKYLEIKYSVDRQRELLSILKVISIYRQLSIGEIKKLLATYREEQSIFIEIDEKEIAYVIRDLNRFNLELNILASL